MNQKIKFRRIGISLILALAAASLTFAVGYAASYIYSENTLVFWGGTYKTPTSMPSTGCRGGYCKYLTQTSNASSWRWYSTTNPIRWWYAYCPTIGETAVGYHVKEYSGDFWSITVNQLNEDNQGTFVYLGFSSPDYDGGYIILHNGCIWGCWGWKVYWDDVKYVTGPS